MITSYQARVLPIERIVALTENAQGMAPIPATCLRALALNAAEKIAARDRLIEELRSTINQLRGGQDGDRL